MIGIALLALALETSAQLVLDQQYYARVCDAAPQSMYYYNYVPGATNLPSLFTYLDYDYYLGYSNYLYFCQPLVLNIDPTVNNCCLESVVNSLTGGLNSGMRTQNYTNGGSDLALTPAAFPVTANGAKFCSVTSLDGHNTTLNGYLQVWYQANGVCTDKHTTCSSTGMLSIFPAAGCTGTPDSYQLGVPAVPINGLGNVRGSLVTISGGAQVDAWSYVFPGYAFVPLFHNSAEIVGSILGWGTTAVGLAFTVSAGMKLVPFKAWNAALFGCFVVWTVTNAMITIGWLVVFPSSQSITIFVVFLDALINVASLLNVLLVNHFMVKLLVLQLDRWLGYAILAIPILLHLALAGYNYLYYFSSYYYLTQITDPVAYDQAYTVALAIYYTMYVQMLPYWTMVMFLWDCGVPILVCLKLLHGSKSGSLMERLQRLFAIVPSLPYVLVTQLLIFVTYFILRYIGVSTILWGGQRQQAAVGSTIEPSLLLIHSLLNYQLSLSIKVVSRDPRYTSASKLSGAGDDSSFFSRVKSLIGRFVAPYSKSGSTYGSTATDASKSHTTGGGKTGTSFGTASSPVKTKLTSPTDSQMTNSVAATETLQARAHGRQESDIGSPTILLPERR